MTREISSQKCHLEPLDLDDKAQFTELERQRIICGWQYDQNFLQSWKDNRDKKTLFWITIPNPEDETKRIRAGHISLEASASLLDPDLLVEGEIALTLTNFFILPEYRGIGKFAVRELEKLAVTKPYGDPRCRYLTLSALSKRYVYDEEYTGLWAKLGAEKSTFSIHEWYEKLGYVTWIEVPMLEELTLDGDMVTLWEALMRKDLRGII